MANIAKIKVCEICEEEYIIYYDRGETDEKECPRCTELWIEFIPEDLTPDYEM